MRTESKASMKLWMRQFLSDFFKAPGLDKPWLRVLYYAVISTFYIVLYIFSWTLVIGLFGKVGSTLYGIFNITFFVWAFIVSSEQKEGNDKNESDI